ncbi:hypothetical protein LAM01_08080 [Amylolactobacillus amylophilus]|nr:hypothetical protein LAM01_08080 [Amylolactobacillus amylophilus]
MIIGLIAIFGSIIITIIAVFLSLILVGVLATYTGLGLLAGSWAVGLTYLGGGVLAIGLVLLLIPVLKWLLVGISHVVAQIFRWFYRKTLGRHSAEVQG